MKIVRTTPDRIEMPGMPHAGFALLGGAVVCPLLAAGGRRGAGCPANHAAPGF